MVQLFCNSEWLQLTHMLLGQKTEIMDGFLFEEIPSHEKEASTATLLSS
jgi:hypothetical protein